MMKFIRSGVLALLLPRLLAFLQRKFAYPAPTRPAGHRAIPRTRRIHPLLALAGSIVGTIVTAVIYKKFAPGSESMRAANARVVE